MVRRVCFFYVAVVSCSAKKKLVTFGCGPIGASRNQDRKDSTMRQTSNEASWVDEKRRDALSCGGGRDLVWGWGFDG